MTQFLFLVETTLPIECAIFAKKIASCIDTLIPSLQMHAESPDVFEHCHYRDGNSMFCPLLLGGTVQLLQEQTCKLCLTVFVDYVYVVH